MDLQFLRFYTLFGLLVVVWLYVRQDKKLRNREYKVCLNERAIVRLLDLTIDCNIDKSIKNFPIPSRNTFRFTFWNYTFAIVFSVTDNRNKSNCKVTSNKFSSKFPRTYGRGIFRDGQSQPDFVGYFHPRDYRRGITKE